MRIPYRRGIESSSEPAARTGDQPFPSDRRATRMGGMAARARVVVPVDLDRSPRTTVMLAAVIARQADAEVEFVAQADAADHDVLTRLCATAVAAGAPRATFALLERG